MTPHEILGVEPGATEKEIRSAFRKKAKTVHPDTNPNDPDAAKKFNELQRAYETLTKPESQQTGFGHNPFGGNPFSGFGANFDDLLRQFQQEQRRAATSIQAVLTLTLQQAFEGMAASLSIANRVVTVDIPAGVQDGQRFILTGEGHADPETGSKGDLILIVRINPDARFQRVNNDLVMMLERDYIEIMLGSTIEIETISGQKLETKLEPGTRPVRITGHGMPIANSNGQRGDLYIRVSPVEPKLDAEEIERLKKVRNSS